MRDSSSRPDIFFSSKHILPLALSLALTACGGGSGSGNSQNLTLSGSVNTSDYPLAARAGWTQKLAGWLGFRSACAQDIGSVDTLVAIPSDGGNIDIGVFDQIRTAQIAADGHFELTLTKEYDWVLLLVNASAQTADDKVVAYVSVPASAAVTDDGSLVDLPFSTANGSAIDLGELSASATDARSADSSNDAESIEARLSLTLEQLKEYARRDDAYRHFANVYLNYSERSREFYFPHVEWSWQGASLDTLGNDATRPSDFSLSRVSGEIETNTDSLSFNNLCDGTTSLGLFPPAAITLGGASFDTLNGIMNSAMSSGQSSYDYCYNDHMGIQTTDSGASTLVFKFDLASTDGGLWRLKADGQQIAAFDFSLSNPLDAAGNPLGFIPVIHIHRDPQNTDHIQSIEIQWLQYDSANHQYVEAKDDAVTDKLVAQSFINLVDYSPAANGQDVSFIQYDQTGLLSGTVTVGGKYQWYLGATTTSDPANGIAHVSDLSISYSQGGVSYRFTWNDARH